MPDAQIYDQHEEWQDAQGNPVSPGTAGATRYRLTTYDDGTTEAEEWIPAKPTGGVWEGGPFSTPPGPNQGDWSASYRVATPKDVAARLKAEQKISPEDTAGAWSIQTDKSTGQEYRVNKITGETQPIGIGGQQGKYITDSAGNEVWIPPQDRRIQDWQDPQASGLSQPQPKIVYQDPNAELKRQAAEANLAEIQRRTANIGNRNLTPAELQLQQLDVQKAQQGLEDPVSKALRQQHEAISTIQAQLASGQLQPEEADRLMALSRSNLQAALQGTTPYQQQQRLDTLKKQREELARNTIADQLGYGSSMATGLLSGLGGIYGKILSSASPPYAGFDPLAMAKGYMQDVGGGPQLSDMARSVLMGAFGQQGGQ